MKGGRKEETNKWYWRTDEKDKIEVRNLGKENGKALKVK